MIRYEIRERAPIFGIGWIVRAAFDNVGDARGYWSTAVFDGVEAELVQIKCTETRQHYHSADGTEAY
jgi:hypothetical protein